MNRLRKDWDVKGQQAESQLLAGPRLFRRSWQWPYRRSDRWLGADAPHWPAIAAWIILSLSPALRRGGAFYLFRGGALLLSSARRQTAAQGGSGETWQGI